MKDIISKLVSEDVISGEDVANALQIILNGEATNAQIGAFISSLRIKGETPEIISSCVDVMRNHAKKIKCKDDKIPILGWILVLIPEEKPNKRLINGKYVWLLRKSLILNSSSLSTE